MTVIEALRGDQPRYAQIRRDIHAHPELAYAEHRTADLVARHLEALGIETHRGIGGTGVVGVLRAGKGSRAIGLRADMDALPMQEHNEFAHRSTHDGCMHACGHDGHTTMLLAAAEALAKHPDFDGTVYLVFQPAEEGMAGAKAMLDDGIFDRFPMDAIFGLHNWPGVQAGHFAVHDGPVMAAADRFDIEVTGIGCHAAMPHLGVDPVVAAAAVVQAFQTIAARTVDPLDAAVVSTTIFQAGKAQNVIPDRVEMAGTVRSFREEVRETVRRRMQEICDGIGAAHGVKIALNYRAGYPATVNSSDEAALCAEVARALVGADQVTTAMRPSMGSEDFAFFLREKPGCYVWLGNGPGEGGCLLHNPRYDFNDDLIPVGAAYWVELTRRLLAAAR